MSENTTHVVKSMGVSDAAVDMVTRHVQSAHDAALADMERFVTRFKETCEIRGIVGERLQRLLTSAEGGPKGRGVGLIPQLEHYSRTVGRAAQNAYTPTTGRDVRHISTTRVQKAEKADRARRFAIAHAADMDIQVRKGAYMAALEHDFCTSRHRDHKRQLRQAARFLAMDSHLILPVVFGGTKWYDHSLCK